MRPLLTQNVEWVEIPTDGTNSKILATFISFPFHGAGMRTCLVHGHRLFTFSLWRTAWLCFKEILQVKVLDTMGYFYWGLVGGNSHCSLGDFLTVFPLLACPGEFLAVDQTCLGEFLSVVFVNGSISSIYKFHVAFPLFLQN